MRLVITSDTHGRHDLIKDLPAGDVFVHAGDFMNYGLHPEEIISFNRWLAKQPIAHKVVCGGNHDRLFQLSRLTSRDLLNDATYLENTGVTIGGISFLGSPYTPEFLNCVIDGLIAVIAGHHNLHVVVEAGCSQTLEIGERGRVREW